MREKFYMLLELEKIRQNSHKLKGIYPFPVRPLEFEVLVVTGMSHTTLVMKKEKIEDDWCLMTQDLKEFDFKHVEACKVLEKINFNKQREGEGKAEELSETLLRHRGILDAMEKFNRIKEKGDEENYEGFIKKHKEKNGQLLEGVFIMQ